MAGGVGELGVLGVRDLVPVQQEIIERDRVRRTLVRQAVVGAHREFSARDQQHPRRAGSGRANAAASQRGGDRQSRGQRASQACYPLHWRIIAEDETSSRPGPALACPGFALDGDARVFQHFGQRVQILGGLAGKNLRNRFVVVGVHGVPKRPALGRKGHGLNSPVRS